MKNSTEKPSGFARLLGYAASCKGYYIASIILAVFGVASGMVPYFSVSKILLLLIEGSRELSIYLLWCAVAAAGYICKEVFHSISTAISHKATFKVMSEIRRKITSKLTRVPMGYNLETSSGTLKNIMVEKVDSIEPSLSHLLPEMTSNLLVPFAIIGYLFVLDWRMALISLVTLPVGYICYMGMMKDYEVKFKKYIDAGRNMNEAVVEYINGIEVIKTFGQSANSYKKYADAVRSSADYALEWMRGLQMYSAMGLAIWPATLIGVLPLGHDNRMKKNSTKLCTEINIKFETKSSIRLFLDINYL